MEQQSSDNDNNNNTTITPIIRLPCISLSGFTDHKEEKNRLVDVITSLGGSHNESAVFEGSITHVVTYKSTRTMKTYAGLLTGRWVMNEEWVYESEKAGGFVPEQK